MVHRTDKCFDVTLRQFIGLSKERPILADHPKAHILDFMKSGGFRTDFMKSGGFQVKSWNPPDFERPIARTGKPYVFSGHQKVKVTWSEVMCLLIMQRSKEYDYHEQSNHENTPMLCVLHMAYAGQKVS